MEKEKCKICGSKNNLLFSGKILNKYEISYFQCPNCGFIQTEEPYWLDESYSSAITDLDIGYVSRNMMYNDFVSSFILNNKQFDDCGRFLDYGGGYGLFVRMMRDKGFDFYREDKYCDNFFAKHFDLKDIMSKSQFEILTCFEVFEHLVNPLFEIEEMLKYSNSIFFSTELVPQKKLTSVYDWWYFAPEHGQHIAFYTLKSLEYIAEKYGLNFYTNNQSTHLFTNRVLNSSCLYLQKRNILHRIFRHFFPSDQGKKVKTSLLNQDVQYIQFLLNQKIHSL